MRLENYRTCAVLKIVPEGYTTQQENIHFTTWMVSGELEAQDKE